MTRLRCIPFSVTCQDQTYVIALAVFDIIASVENFHMYNGGTSSLWGWRRRIHRTQGRTQVKFVRALSYLKKNVFNDFKFVLEVPPLIYLPGSSHFHLQIIMFERGFFYNLPGSMQKDNTFGDPCSKTYGSLEHASGITHSSFSTY
jgi:hypothetical protein